MAHSPIREELEQEFIDQYPQNPLLKFRSYSYHHILYMCDSTSTVEELISELKSLAGTSDPLRTQYAVQTATGRTSLDDKMEGEVRSTATGKYVVILNGTINSDYIITDLKWSSITAANVFKGDQYTSLAADGQMRIIEPRGIKFLNTLADSCKLLQIGGESAVFVLKTYFVGVANDGVADSVEVISDIKPLTFLIQDVVGTFTEDGGAYDLEFVALSNGATRRPHMVRMENFHAQLEPSLRGSMLKLQRYINTESASYFDCVRSASQQAFSGPSTSGSLEEESLTADKLVPVIYEIFIDEKYNSPKYAVNNGPQAYKERGLCVEPINLKLGQVSIETAIRTIMESSVQVLLDRKGGETGYDDKVDYRIHSTIDSTSPGGNKVPPTVKVKFFVTQYKIIDGSMIAKITSANPNDEEEKAALKQQIKNNLVAYRYIYTGRNIDILNFDIKMQFGLGFFNIISQTNNIKEHTQRVPSVGVAGAPSHQTGTATAVYTPVFFGTNLRSPKGFNTTDANSTITYNSAMGRWASVEAAEAKMTIVGNPRFLGQLSNIPSDYSNALTTFVKVGDGTPISQNRGPVVADATMNDWGFFPALARVQIMMPNTANEIAGRANAADGGTKYADEFWYDGYYYIFGITNIFEDGKFTQELELMTMLKDLTDVASKDQTTKFNELLTNCVTEKHKIPDAAPTNAEPQGPPPAPPPAGPYTAKTPGPADSERAAMLSKAYAGLYNAWKKKGYSDQQAKAYAEGGAAQFALESSWGKRTSNTHNYFGIKSSERGTTRTTEVRNGKTVVEYASFKAYPTFNDGMEGYVDFITRNPRYRKAGAFEAQSSEQYIAALHRAGYATDPEYQQKIRAIQLGKTYQQGVGVTGSAPSNVLAPPAPTESPVPPKQSVDQVKQQQLGSAATVPEGKTACDKQAATGAKSATPEKKETPQGAADSKGNFVGYKPVTQSYEQKVADVNKQYSSVKLAEQEKSVMKAYDKRDMLDDAHKKALTEKVKEYNSLAAVHKSAKADAEQGLTDLKEAAHTASNDPRYTAHATAPPISDDMKKRIEQQQEKVTKATQKADETGKKLDQLSQEIEGSLPNR